MFILSLTSENDALRHSRGHGKITCKFRLTLYRVHPQTLRRSLARRAKLADTVRLRAVTVLHNTVSCLPAGASPPRVQGTESPLGVWGESPDMTFRTRHSPECRAFSRGHGKMTCKFRLCVMPCSTSDSRWRMTLVQCRSYIGKRSGAPFSGTW